MFIFPPPRDPDNAEPEFSFRGQSENTEKWRQRNPAGVRQRAACSGTPCALQEAALSMELLFQIHIHPYELNTGG